MSARSELVNFLKCETILTFTQLQGLITQKDTRWFLTHWQICSSTDRKSNDASLCQILWQLAKKLWQKWRPHFASESDPFFLIYYEPQSLQKPHVWRAEWKPTGGSQSQSHRRKGNFQLKSTFVISNNSPPHVSLLHPCTSVGDTRLAADQFDFSGKTQTKSSSLISAKLSLFKLPLGSHLAALIYRIKPCCWNWCLHYAVRWLTSHELSTFTHTGILCSYCTVETCEWAQVSQMHSDCVKTPQAPVAFSMCTRTALELNICRCSCDFQTCMY